MAHKQGFKSIELEKPSGTALPERSPVTLHLTTGVLPELKDKNIDDECVIVLKARIKGIHESYDKKGEYSYDLEGTGIRLIAKGKGKEHYSKY